MKLFLRILTSILLVICMIFVPKNLYGELNQDKITDEMYRRREKYFYGVITLWQIDSFEGGTGSRANWLKSVVAGFERRNNGVFINVETISSTLAQQLISSGQKRPDLISFGADCDFNSADFEALKIETENIHPSVKKITLENAIPWCMGAYFMFGQGDENQWGTDGKIITAKKAKKSVFSVGLPIKQGYNSAKNLEHLSGNFSAELSLKTASPQELFEGYNYSQNINRIVGTQRDFYRLEAAKSREKARAGDIKFLGYSDLFQYIGILKCENEKKTATMQDFIAFLLEPEQQNKLGTIGLFPVRVDALPQYNNENMNYWWNEIKTINFKSDTMLFQTAKGQAEWEKSLQKLKTPIN
ncbi:MAG: hypothetical protein IKB86_02590 [Clostridia bacterium]|nr:hypothetical protein [Clostridia bacterium]